MSCLAKRTCAKTLCTTTQNQGMISLVRNVQMQGYHHSAPVFQSTPMEQSSQYRIPSELAFKMWDLSDSDTDSIHGADPDCESPLIYYWHRNPSSTNRWANQSHISKRHRSAANPSDYSTVTNNPSIHSTIKRGYSHVATQLHVNAWFQRLSHLLLRCSGYFSDRESRHRCCYFAYIKASRRAMNPLFWEVFELEDNLTIKVQLLTLHLWIIKTRMMRLPSTYGRKLSYESYRIMFNELTYRFRPQIPDSVIPEWESQCQQIALRLTVALDNALETKGSVKHAFVDTIWRELYLSGSVDANLLNGWSDYIESEIGNLSNVDKFDMLNGWYQFGPMPTLDKHTLNDKLSCVLDF